MSNSICLQKIARNFKAGAPHLCTLLAQFVRACWPSKSAHIQTRAHETLTQTRHTCVHDTKTWHIHRERVKHVDECETEIETESSRRSSTSSSRDISEMANTTSNNKRHKKTENNESSSVSRRQRQPHSDKKEERSKRRNISYLQQYVIIFCFVCVIFFLILYVKTAAYIE